MEKIKIIPGLENDIQDNEMKINSGEIIPSDIPYYVSIEEKVTLENSFMPSKEKIEMLILDKIEFHIGIKSGKIYKINIDSYKTVQELENAIVKLVSENKKIHSKINNDRKIRNIRFTGFILKEAYKVKINKKNK